MSIIRRATSAELSTFTSYSSDVLSSADVARRLMIIAKRGKWQFVIKNLPLGALSSRSVSSLLVGELFKKFGLFFLTQVYTTHCGILKAYWTLYLCAYLFRSDIVTQRDVAKECNEQRGSFQIHHRRQVESSQIRCVRYLTYLSPETSIIEIKHF